MTGKSSAREHGTTGDGAGRGGLRRLFDRTGKQDRSSRRAGAEPFPAVLVTPRVWVALG